MNRQVAAYLRENVLGRQLRTADVAYELENGALRGVYSDIMTFSDMMLTECGICFNMTTVASEKVHCVSSSGESGEVKKDFTGTSVFHYALAMRKSTGRMTGHMRGVSTSVVGHTMEAVIYGVYDVNLEGDELRWRERQLFYRDMPAEGNAFRPVAFDSEIRFFLENGKVRFEYVPVYYDVDPVTMSRTLSRDGYPPFVAKER